ncbi:hypothetical protein COM11_14830 [Bacillus pseudomycoides]|nr:hypothetical protein CON79_06630 [Bacillus pseudomycoides]PFZ11035.1 hypothetical protein COL63_17820 [Bacillus pseudomycoides]PGC29028.1 hypothetical protein COM11_14830 [Bacillus pseudomycoides]PGC47612.1 hypothetical protein COM14_14595 [Bacillus pseudomycoides]PGD26012.1 hypothetical protein COM30_25220 [Bacillus pseudomycoides]
MLENESGYINCPLGINPFLLGGKEDPSMDRSGQCLFFAPCRVKTKEESERGIYFCFQSSDLYVGKSKYI